MKLREKVLIMIGATLAGMVGILYSASSIIFQTAIAKSEEHSARQTLQGVLNVVAQTQEDFDNRFADWSAWDDSYRFIQNRNSSYQESNLVPGTLKSLNVNLILFVDPSGKLVYGTGFDSARSRVTPIPEAVREHLKPNDRLIQHSNPKSNLAGILALPDGALMISSRPIVTSAGKGPIRGTLIMGRYLSSAEVERLARITHLPLTLYRINDPALPVNVQAARSALSVQSAIAFSPMSKQTMAGYMLLKDIYDQPAVILRGELPRKIYQQGETSLRYLIIAVMITGLIFGGMTLLLLERSVLSRLSRLSRSVSQIGQRGDFSMRVQHLAGADELPMLARDVNRMLAALEQSQQEVTALNQQMLTKAHQEKTDLEILLDTMTEHSDTITFGLEQQIEEQFQLITEATPVGILITQVTEGRILYANETAGLMFGAASQALLNYKMLDFYVNPAERQSIIASLDQQQFQGEVQFKQADGKLFWALLSLRYFVFQDERSILTAVSDITARKQAEEALRLAEENYRSIFENALDGIYQSAPDGYYLRVNLAMAQILGYSSPANMIASITDIRREYVDENDWTVFKQLIQAQGKVTGFESQMYRQDGSMIWVSESARSVRDLAGNLLYYEGIVEDITQRKREEARLRQQVQELQIEIDQAKRKQQVAEISQTDYFQKLLQDADELRYSEDDAS